MRQPGTEASRLNWWRLAITGHNPPRHDGDPQPGFYRLRRVRGGPWCAAVIYVHAETDPETGELTEPEALRALVNGEDADPEKIWLSCRPVSAEEYARIADMQDAMPDMKDTGKRINLDALRPITPTRRNA